MHYYEVLIADSRYHSDSPLTYASKNPLPILSVVTVPLRQYSVTGFVIAEKNKPDFPTKEIKLAVSSQPLPAHCLKLAEWMSAYYCANLSETLRQFAPTKPSLRLKEAELPVHDGNLSLQLDSPLTSDQKQALEKIRRSPSTTVLLHGETGTGKTRVYLELAKETLRSGHSVLLLTPEISLTPQLVLVVRRYLDSPAIILHSQLSVSEKKKIWRKILESSEPMVVVGPRSALFAPLSSIGLIVIDEAHEPAYKQDQAPRYHTARVASQLGALTGAKVVLGTATPSLTDYYLAQEKNALVRMRQPAVTKEKAPTQVKVVDMKDRQAFTKNPYLSNILIDEISKTLSAKKQTLLYLNRRGSARLILCRQCGWEMLCPNCDIPLVYHGDAHEARCHICSFAGKPPTNCPTCSNPDIVYRTIGTKSLMDSVTKLFPDALIRRFDSDNTADEQIDKLYCEIHQGKIDILIGTQILAKGLDLPKLELVGIMSAETSMTLPDYTSEERAMQLLYQVIGRVGRGHGQGKVIIQSYNPDSKIIKAAVARDYEDFYNYALKERKQFRFPPFSYLLQLVCKKTTEQSAKRAAQQLKTRLLEQGLPVEIIGPAASFYKRRGRFYYYQLVIKSKKRVHLIKLAKTVPADWRINLDPANLL